MKKAVIVLFLVLFVFGCTQTAPETTDNNYQSAITNFDECIAAGNPAMESFPRQCADPVSGNTFVEVITPPGTIAGTYTDLSPAEAKALIDSTSDLIIIDVSPHYDEGHLPGAIHYYLGDGSLDAAIPSLDPEGTYLVYCHVDSVAIAGAQKLVDAGFENVYRLEGNYPGWVAAGYDVEKTPEISVGLPVAYSHPAFSGTDEKDCFDDICITRDDSQAVFAEGSVKWGCGACGEEIVWYDEVDKSFQQNCVGSRMVNIVGKDICLDTGVNKWDIVFASYSGGGESGEFSYTRTLYSE